MFIARCSSGAVCITMVLFCLFRRGTRLLASIIRRYHTYSIVLHPLICAIRSEAVTVDSVVVVHVTGRVHIPRISCVPSVRATQPHVLRTAYIRINLFFITFCIRFCPGSYQVSDFYRLTAPVFYSF